MHRWAPRGGLGILLFLAYPLLTHAAVTTGLAYLAWTAWLCIAALVLLSFPARGAWRVSRCSQGRRSSSMRKPC